MPPVFVALKVLSLADLAHCPVVFVALKVLSLADLAHCPVEVITTSNNAVIRWYNKSSTSSAMASYVQAGMWFTINNMSSQFDMSVKCILDTCSIAHYCASSVFCCLS